MRGDQPCTNIRKAPDRLFACSTFTDVFLFGITEGSTYISSVNKTVQLVSHMYALLVQKSAVKRRSGFARHRFEQQIFRF